MIKGVLAGHDLRYALTNELHAKPFAELGAPGRAVVLAIMPPRAAAERDPAADRAHLIAFIDRHGGAHPAPDASHHSADFGRFRLKWERHTAFVSYTLYEEGPVDNLFQAGFQSGLVGQAAGAPPEAVLLERLTALSAGIEAQNQELLESMNRRAALQLRLQQMVDGLSVVAISYYAVSLAGYLLAPLAPILATRAGFDKSLLTALTVIPVVALVWWSIRRLRKRIGGRGE